MKFESRTAFLVVHLLIIPLLICSQSQNLYFETYNSLHGLSQNSCYAIAQDGKGFMWFGTQDGLNRFDGNEFRVYLPNNEIGKPLPSNHVTSLKYDRFDEILWVGTIRGMSLYAQKNDSMIPVSDIYPFAVGLETTPIKDIYQFRQGEIWIVTQLDGLILVNLETKKMRQYFDEQGIQEHVNGVAVHRDYIVVSVQDRLYALHSEKLGKSFNEVDVDVDFSLIRELHSFQDQLWVGTTNQGCFIIEGFENLNQVKHFEYLPQGGVGGFMSDQNGKLWIGTRGNGILVYDPDSDSVIKARYNKFDDRSLGKDFVLSLFLDRQDNVWCGLSGGGVSQFDPLKYQFTSIQNDPLDSNSLPGNMVFEIYKSQSGRHYVGTQNRGFVYWDYSQNRFYDYPYFSNAGIPINTVYDITNHDEQSLWIATWGGLLYFDEKTQEFSMQEGGNHPASQNLYAVHKLYHQDSLLVAGQHGVMYFDLKSKAWIPCSPSFFEQQVIIGRHIWEGENGVVWIGTEGGGLVKLDYLNQEVKRIETLVDISQNFRFILEDGNQFWIATDNGVVVYDYIDDQVIQHLALDNHHQSNVCYSILKDRSGNFWVGTNFGLLKINAQDYTTNYYNHHNGLKFLEFNTAAALPKDSGELLFGGVGGITKFNPQRLRLNTFSPDPIITSVLVKNQSVPTTPLNKPTFDYQKNHVTFTFTSNNFSNPGRNKYYYRIAGLTDGWIDNSYHHSTTFNSLPPGEYTFQVKSENSDGISSKGSADYSFIIYPPWWQSWWFLLIVMAIIIFTTAIVIRRRLNSIRNRSELQRRIVETEMMALRAQMNPHFIFNCLNSIDAFIQSNNKYQATTYLNKFARLLRNVLDSSRQTTITFSKDFETLKLYLELEQLRHSNKFRTEIYADKMLMHDDFQVPPLLIQPYVENAILHGLKYRSDNEGLLKINARLFNDKIHYTIVDNGVGRNLSKNGITREGTSYGMKLTSDRVRYFNQEKVASVIVTDLVKNDQAAGTKIEVFLELK